MISAAYEVLGSSSGLQCRRAKMVLKRLSLLPALPICYFIRVMNLTMMAGAIAIPISR